MNCSEYFVMLSIMDSKYKSIVVDRELFVIVVSEIYLLPSVELLYRKELCSNSSASDYCTRCSSLGSLRSLGSLIISVLWSRNKIYRRTTSCVVSSRSILLSDNLLFTHYLFISLHLLATNSFKVWPSGLPFLCSYK